MLTIKSKTGNSIADVLEVTKCCAQPWASFQKRKIAGCTCAGNAGNVFPRDWLHRKPLVSDPDMHHRTCVMHMPWCLSGSLTRGHGENVPDIPSACASATLRIWQETHWGVLRWELIVNYLSFFQNQQNNLSVIYMCILDRCLLSLAAEIFDTNLTKLSKNVIKQKNW